MAPPPWKHTYLFHACMGEEVNLPVYVLEAMGNSLIESILLTEGREKQGLLAFYGISIRWIG